MSESKLFIAFYNENGPVSPNVRRVKILAESKARARKMLGDRGFKYANPDLIKRAYQPDPSIFKILDTETEQLFPYQTIEAIIGKGERYQKVPFIDLDTVSTVFIVTTRFNANYSAQIYGISPTGKSNFFITTDIWKHRGDGRSVARELLAHISGENPRDKVKIFDNEVRVGRKRDLHPFDPQTGENTLQILEDRDDSNIHRFENLRYCLA